MILPLLQQYEIYVSDIHEKMHKSVAKWVLKCVFSGACLLAPVIVLFFPSFKWWKSLRAKCAPLCKLDRSSLSHFLLPSPCPSCSLSASQTSWSGWRGIIWHSELTAWSPNGTPAKGDLETLHLSKTFGELPAKQPPASTSSFYRK